jgi:hypothetical protein
MSLLEVDFETRAQSRFRIDSFRNRRGRSSGQRCSAIWRLRSEIGEYRALDDGAS